MYSPQVTRYALDVERAGPAGHGAASGQAGSPTCGDTVRIELVPEGGVIARARFRAFGCPHATAAAALACELAEGRGPLEAALIGAGELERRLGSAPAGHGCVSLAADALHGALAGTLDRCSPPSDPARVAVAMSGGVDSAVALLKAVRSGLRPVGVTLRLWIDPQAPDTARACCSPESVRSARSTCHALGVPHITLDLREEFRSDVVERFIGEYAAGRTPNPCVRCNGAFRFAALAAFADRVGAARIATGHYARIVRRGGRALVARAADGEKDQSYMLSRVPSTILERVWFPLGDQPKHRTRREALAAGLEAASRPESQEVCFVGGGDYRAFLERHGGRGPAGEVVDERGNVLGRHDGLHRFTPGQRRGLGITAREPLYVLRTEARSGRVVAGGHERLAILRVRVSPGELFVPARRVQVKLRYRSRPVWAQVTGLDGGFELELEEPAYGVAPGQAAVLYAEDAVVGAGLIDV